MFVLAAKLNNEAVYYNGKAGPAWVSPSKGEAFPYSEQEAGRKAALFNRNTALHGLAFVVEARA